MHRRRYTARRALPLLGVLLLAACAPQIRPVPIRTPTPGGGPPVSEPNAARVILFGHAVDQSTGAIIPFAESTTTTVDGVQYFTGAYRVIVPGKSVVRLHVKAAGYQTLNFEIKPHYERDMRLEGKLQMEPR